MNPRIDLFWQIIHRLWQLLWGKNVLTERMTKRLRSRSVFIRHLDAGSSNDNEIEVTALGSPQYDLAHYGRKIVASPRHADVLLISLPLTRNMVEAVRMTLEAMPEPRVVLTMGDGGGTESVFADSYAVVPMPEEFRGEGYRHITAHDGTGAEIFPPPAREVLRELLEL